MRKIDATETLPPGWLDGRSWVVGPEPVLSYKDPAASPTSAAEEVDAVIWGGSLDDGTTIAQITWGAGSISARWRPENGLRCEEEISGTAAPKERRTVINAMWSDYLAAHAKAIENTRAMFARQGWPHP